jgi:hypothetical protein
VLRKAVARHGAADEGIGGHRVGQASALRIPLQARVLEAFCRCLTLFRR